MRYVIDIPDSEVDGFDTRLTIEASDWMSALRLMLEREGKDISIGQLLCDIQADQSVRVFDPESAKVFWLRPATSLSAVPAAQVSDTFEMSPEAREKLVQGLKQPSPTPSAGTPGAETPRAGTPRVGTARVGPPRVVHEHRTESGSFVAVRPPLFDPDHIEDTLVESILEELQWIYAADRSLEEVTDRVLDLAMRLVPSESGSVLFPGLHGTDLFFAAARGPKATDVLQFRVPLNSGIVGFSIREGVSLAIQEAHKDARLYAVIAESIDYPPETIICAPLTFEGRVFGAIELLNRLTGEAYTLAELGMLTHVAGQLAQYINLHM